jgi:hypothetical protein
MFFLVVNCLSGSRLHGGFATYIFLTTSAYVGCVTSALTSAWNLTCTGMSLVPDCLSPTCTLLRLRNVLLFFNPTICVLFDCRPFQRFCPLQMAWNIFCRPLCPYCSFCSCLKLITRQKKEIGFYIAMLASTKVLRSG